MSLLTTCKNAVLFLGTVYKFIYLFIYFLTMLRTVVQLRTFPFES